MLSPVDWQVVTDFSEDRTAYIFDCQTLKTKTLRSFETLGNIYRLTRLNVPLRLENFRYRVAVFNRLCTYFPVYHNKLNYCKSSIGRSVTEVFYPVHYTTMREETATSTRACIYVYQANWALNVTFGSVRLTCVKEKRHCLGFEFVYIYSPISQRGMVP